MKENIKDMGVTEDEIKDAITLLGEFFEANDIGHGAAYAAMISLCKILEKKGFSSRERGDA